MIATKTANVLARDEMDTAAFDAMMEEGLAQAKAGQRLPLGEVLQRMQSTVAT